MGGYQEPGDEPRLTLLGGFRLRLVNQNVKVAGVVQRLIAFLALEDDPVERWSVARGLWPSANSHHADASLRSALYKARGYGQPLIRTSMSHLQLVTESRVDVWEMTARSMKILDPESSLSGQDLHTDIFRHGELLPGWNDPWVIRERERLRQLRLHALEKLSERLVEHRRFGDAVHAAYLAIRSDPLRESSHRALMRAHLAEANIGEARRTYQSWRDIARRELRSEPSIEMRRLLDAAADLV